ncbi:MAG: DUF4381 domain-containing protein [Gammaproteobacteria bacterium]|nr:DUF4381 domain-containing protein [Gammaproteobacteria bacterium]
MQPPQQQLDLKDIHLPDTLSWWPLAAGYWIIFVCIIIAVMTYLIIRSYRKKHEIRRLALAEYQRIKKAYAENHDPKQLSAALSALLRRAAISSYPESECAGLIGKPWLNWLDKQLSNSTLNFSNGPGYLLTEFIYSSSQKADDIDDLLKLSLLWLKQLPPPTGKSA